MASVADDLPRDLVWADDTEPGIRRRRAGRGFVYVGPDGRRVTDEALLARIRSIAVPPAWTDVWICLDANGHLQATGRDAKGRKQYRYHARFRAHRDEIKFDKLYDFGRALPAVRKQVAADLELPGMPRERVIATVVRLLEATMIRVGNEEYARANGSYGLTTLRDQHARFDTGALRLVFNGKHGARTDVAVPDRRLRRIVKQCQDLPGQTLFQYLDSTDEPRAVTSTDVNEYLRTVSGLDVTAKDFRTWMATLLAATAFADLAPPANVTQAKRATTEVLEFVSSHLNNTPTVSRASYVHPLVVERYAQGSFHDHWNAAPARGSRLLVPEERKLVAFLRTPRRAARRDAA